MLTHTHKAECDCSSFRFIAFVAFSSFQILRNHVMVRVGGGWDTLNHFLAKHDECRKANPRKCHHYCVWSGWGWGGCCSRAYNDPLRNIHNRLRAEPIHPLINWLRAYFISYLIPPYEIKLKSNYGGKHP